MKTDRLTLAPTSFPSSARELAAKLRFACLASRERQRPEDRRASNESAPLRSLTLPARLGSRTAPRAAFTLVELLVAIAIIAVLGALVAAGVMSWIGAQARRNTEIEIRTLHKALLDHWNAVVTDAKNEKSIPNLVLKMADNDPNRAKIIWIKIRLMEAFPVNFSEIKNAYAAAPLGYIPAGPKRRYMGAYASALPAGYVAAPPGKTESAACLLMALGINRGGVAHGTDMLRPFTRDTNNDKVLELVDGWGEPLYFYRFATGNDDLQKSAPGYPRPLPTPNPLKPVLLDPLDPTGLLVPPSWTNGSFVNFDKQIHTRLTLDKSQAWYAVPALVSSGPNFKLGLAANLVAPYQDMSVGPSPQDAKDADDNIYSFKIK